MEKDALLLFFERIANDPRISATHISVFVALYTLCCNKTCRSVTVFSRDVMAMAKINATNTYHRCIRDLAAYGYLEYKPSYNRYVGSKVSI